MLVRFLAALLLVLGLAAPVAAQDKRIALTFDDAPRDRGAFLTPDERTARLIDGLKRAGVEQAAFFVNPGFLSRPDGQGGEARLAAYVAAGHVLANHSFSHPALTDLTAEQYLADIDRAEAWLSKQPGHRPWFRFPFLNEGRADKARRDAVRAGLRQRGLTNGYVTADASDWNLEGMTIAAKRAGKSMDMDGLRDLYVRMHVDAAEAYDRIARTALGRSPAHVMLMHETDLAALFLPDLVAALRAKGWTIVTADAAYADPIAPLAMTVDVPSAQGTLTEAIAWEKGMPPPRWYEGNSSEVATRWFAEAVLKEAK
ncbi:polysaccharide deacetylase family protein [Sphingomonas sp. FW199]|uniref:polysaccharide deacetylase family protein n=1 Tax=Sphingomonas sp. FW199 TaxID=3400217 RepID=UPI003CEDB0F1